MKELQSQVLGLQRQQQLMFQSFATTAKYAVPSPPVQALHSQPFHNPQWAPQLVHHN